MRTLNTSKSVDTLGICVNKLDSIDDVRKLVDGITVNISEISILFRPHPSDVDRFNLWKRLAEEYKLQYSDPTIEDSYSFLSKTDSIVAGDSNILLEAALFNVYPIYFSFSDCCRDHYGFVQHGLVEYFSDENEIIDKLAELKKEKPSVRSKTKRYCHVIETKYDGNSSGLARNLIESISSKSNSDSRWRLVEAYHIPTYELL